MSSDDQQFLDLLASIPQDVAKYSNQLADYVDKHINSVASNIRDAMDNSSWIPEKLRPLRNDLPYFARTPPPPQGYYEKTVAWVSKNRTTIAVVVAFTGTTLYLVHRRKKEHARKRRAKKLPNGAKKEIVVLACSTFHDPLTRSLAIDLERRGYVVYVTVSSTEEDSLVHQEGKADLRPLWIDLTSTVPNPAVDVHPNLEPIEQALTQVAQEAPSGRAGPGSSMFNMTLAGVVVFPGASGYPEGVLALIPPTEVVDTVNTRLVAPMLTVQQLLPLLANHSIDPKSPSSIVIAYPSIPQSLTPSRQIPESIVTSSLSSLAASLRREVISMSANITVHELKLGNFDLGSVPGGRNVHRSVYSPLSTPRLDPNNSALTHWHSSQRAAIQRTTFGQRPFIKGSSARELHNAVFDALAPPQSFKAFGNYDWQTRKRSSTVFVGSGARLYDLIGGWVPSGVVGLVMHIQEKRRGEIGWRSHQQPAPDSPKHETPPFVPNADNLSSSIGESGVWEKI